MFCLHGESRWGRILTGALVLEGINYPTLVLKWLTSQPVWVLQWSVEKKKVNTLKTLVQEQLVQGHGRDPWACQRSFRGNALEECPTGPEKASPHKVRQKASPTLQHHDNLPQFCFAHWPYPPLLSLYVPALESSPFPVSPLTLYPYLSAPVFPIGCYPLPHLWSAPVP